MSHPVLFNCRNRFLLKAEGRRGKSQFDVNVAGKSVYQSSSAPIRSNSVLQIGVSSFLDCCRGKSTTKFHVFAQLNEEGSFETCPSYQRQLATQRQLGRRLWCKVQDATISSRNV
jgi:hypothetical protein